VSRSSSSGACSDSASVTCSPRRELLDRRHEADGATTTLRWPMPSPCGAGLGDAAHGVDDAR
jgi:hypothetical protein